MIHINTATNVVGQHEKDDDGLNMGCACGCGADAGWCSQPV